MPLGQLKGTDDQRTSPERQGRAKQVYIMLERIEVEPSPQLSQPIFDFHQGQSLLSARNAYHAEPSFLGATAYAIKTFTTIVHTMTQVNSEKKRGMTCV
jgi:hypothetical protein